MPGCSLGAYSGIRHLWLCASTTCSDRSAWLKMYTIAAMQRNWGHQGNDNWYNGFVFAFKRAGCEEEQAVESGLQQ